MAQVNYVREMESFSVYAEANGLTASERLTWLGLFHLFNGRAFASEWPDGYIEIRRADLIAAAGVSKNTVLRARESLAKRGLIDYTIGGGDGGSRYRMVYLSVYGAPVERESVAAQAPPLRVEPAIQYVHSAGDVIGKVVRTEEKDGGISVEAVRVNPSHDGTTQRRETVAADSRASGSEWQPCAAARAVSVRGRYEDAANPSHDGTTPSRDGTTPSHDGTTPSHDGTTKTGDVVTTEYINPSINVELNVEEEEIYNNKPTARARAGEWDVGDDGGVAADSQGSSAYGGTGRKATATTQIEDLRRGTARYESDGCVSRRYESDGGVAADSRGTARYESDGRNGGGRLPPLRNDAERGDGGNCDNEALERAFAELIGRRASPVEVRDITEIAAWCRAEDALILEAIRRAGEAGAQSAGKYVTTCLMRWSDQDIRTAEELETWERLDELSRSARPDIAARGEEKLSAFCRELKIKHGAVNAI